MADSKISQLAAAGALNGSELIEAVQGGVNVQTTTQDIADLGGGGGHVIEDEGTPLTQRANLNFVGAGVTATDAGGKTVVTIPASISDTAYDATSWNGVTDVAPSKNAVRDKIESISPVGAQDLFLSAAAFWPRGTNGCSLLTPTEIATSLFTVQTLDFDQTTQEFAQIQVVFPRNWNNGTITATVYWTAASGSGGVVWGISGGAYSNDDALSTAFGTAQTVSDTFITANDVHITSATSAITLAGTPADSDFIALQISRNPSDGSDTLNADAKLLGVVITITLDAATAQ